MADINGRSQVLGITHLGDMQIQTHPQFHFEMQLFHEIFSSIKVFPLDWQRVGRIACKVNFVQKSYTMQSGDNFFTKMIQVSFKLSEVKGSKAGHFLEQEMHELKT